MCVLILMKGRGILLSEDDTCYEGEFTADMLLSGKVSHIKYFSFIQSNLIFYTIRMEIIYMKELLRRRYTMKMFVSNDFILL